MATEITATAGAQMADAQNQSACIEIFGDETVQKFLAKCRSANTVKTYHNVIRQLNKFFVTNSFKPTLDNRAETETAINNFFAALSAQKKSPATRRQYLTVVKKFFAFLAKQGIYPDVAADVTEKFEKRTTHAKQALTEKQARALLGAVKGDSLIDRRDRAIIALTLQTGCRTCEITRANRGDFRPNEEGEGYLLAVTGKGHRTADADVRVAPAVVELIFSYLELRGDVTDDEPLFASHARNNVKWGNRYSAQSVGKMIKRRMIEVGIKNPKITPHSTRHFAATTAIKAGVDLREVSAMLRHTSVNVTMTYLHDLSVGTRRAEMAVADSLFGGLS